MNLEKLNSYIDDRGFSKGDIAEKLALSRTGFYKKMTGRSHFTDSEICRLAVVLRMTSDEILDIFFADWVHKFAHS